MDAVQGNRIVDFIAFYQRIDVLIVDDIQDLVGAGTQHTFFNVFNHLHQNGKQLIFTSDRAPVDLQNFEERLMSRFKWGLSVELLKPDYTTRLEMLRSRGEEIDLVMLDLSLPDMSGIDFLRKVKEDRRSSGAAIIVTAVRRKSKY